MRIKALIGIISVTAFIFFSSCKENIVDVEEFPEFLIDVNIGTQWKYVDIREKAMIYFTSTLLIDTTFVFDGKPEKWYVFEMIPGGLFYYFFTQRKDGIYHLNSLNEPYLKYKYPPKKNDKYTTWYGEDVTVLTTSEVVKVKAGTFDKCIVYNFKAGTEESDQIFKPGIGLIKYIKYKYEDNERIIDFSYELAEYRKVK